MKMFYSGKFIGDVRNTQNIKLAELAQGLCSTAQLARIESGVRSAEKLLFDSLYERLGQNTERFTAYLDCDEYERLLARIRICCCIDEGRYSDAREQMAAYRKATKNNIHMQYLCLAECELMQKTGSSVSACKDKLMEGIRCTYPEFDIDNIAGYYLSRLEMLLVQQYVNCIEQSGQKDRAAKLYGDILDCLDSDRYEQSERERLYGYAGYRLMKYYIDYGQYNRALEVGEKTYMCIAGREKWTFMTELIEGIAMCREALGEDVSDTRKRLSVLHRMNKRFDVGAAEDYFPRYSEEYAVNVNAVIRKRRIMNNMTQEELADGICDVTTISRLENNRHALSDELRIKLLERLQLPCDKYSLCTKDTFDDGLSQKLKKISYALKRSEFARLTPMPDIPETEALDEALRQAEVLRKNRDGVLVFESEWGIIDNLVFYRESRGDCDRSVIYGSVVKTSYINPVPYDCEIASIIRAMQEGELFREIGRFKLAGEKFMEAIKLSVKLYEAEWLSRLLYLYVQNVLERGDKNIIFKETECVELLEYSYSLACTYDDRKRIKAIRDLCNKYNLRDVSLDY